MNATVPRVEVDDAGRVVRAWVPSRSEPGKEYELERSVGGRWDHIDTSCRGWVEYDRCWHVSLMEAAMAEDERAIVVSSSPLALIEDLTIDSVIKDFQPVGEWRYSFRRKGQEIEGISADGVQDGVRQMARQGEAIRCMEVRLERENEREAFFIGKSGRFIITPDGREILVDTTIRGKRVSKYEQKADGSGEYFNEAWFEHGVTKAARNAEEALMPEALKQWMVEAARQIPPAKGRSSPVRVSQSPRTAAAPQKPEPPPEPPSASPQQQAMAAMGRLKREVDAATFEVWVKDARRSHPQYVTERGALAVSRMPDAIAGAIRDEILLMLELAPADEGGVQGELT